MAVAWLLLGVLPRKLRASCRSQLSLATCTMCIRDSIVISFFLGMAPAEGLAGQHAAQHNALEQVSFRKVGQQNGRGTFGRVGGQRQRRAFAVDVVHGHAGMGGQKVRQK